MIILVIIIASLIPVFIKSGFILSLISLLMINAISALGLNITMGYAGQISIGHAAFMSIGAYTSSLLSMKFGFPLFISIPAGAFISSILGILLGFPALRLRGFYLAIVTMTFGVAVEQFFGWLNITGGHIGLKVTEKFSDVYGYFINLIILILSYVFINAVLKGKTGRAFMSIRENEIAASCNGVSVVKYKLLAFILGAFFGGISGALYAHTIGYIAPSDFGLARSLDILAMVVIGGLGTIGGAITGAFLYTLLPFLFSRSELSVSIIFGSLLIFTTLFMPHGFYYYIKMFYYNWIEYPVIWMLRKNKRPEHRMIQTQYGKIHYFEKSGKMPFVIMIHGNWGTWKWFKPLIDIWDIENGVIALDLPGFGRSDDLKGKISLEKYADSLKAFLDGMNLSDMVFVAHSMGSSVVLKLIEKYQVNPKMLLFLSPSPVKGYHTPPEALPYLKLYSRSISLLKKLIYPSIPNDRKLARKILFEVARMDPRGFTDNAKALEEDLSKSTNYVKSHVVIIRHCEDPLIDSLSYNETKEILKAKEFVIDGFGHNPQILFPKVVLNHLRSSLKEV